MPSPRNHAPALLVVIVLGIALAGIQAVAAQDTATPAALPAGATARPAHVHLGTCDDLGEIAYPLNDVTPVETTAGESVQPDGQTTTSVDATLDDLLAADHAINVHESAENIGVYIACGEITGEPASGQLSIALRELNDSGVVGEAVLEDAGDGTTTVSITLAAAESAPALATPAATTPLVGETFQPGDVIVITTDSLRVRSEPSTEAEALASLPEGSELEVVSGPEEAEGFIWYEVEALDAGEPLSGWVATGADFVDLAG